jgi:hypothetical protein
MTDEHESSHEHHASHEHREAPREHHAAAHEHHAAAHGEHGMPKVDLKKASGAALKGGLKDVIEILKLNKSRISAVAGRESEGITVALVYLIIGAIGAPLGTAVFGVTFFGTRITTPILNALVNCVVAAVVGALVLYVTSFVAEKVFKGKGTFSQYFRVMGYAYLLNVVGFLTMIPFLGALASLYLLVVSFVALKEVHKLDSTNVVLTILVTIGVFIVLCYLLAMFGLSGAMMGWGGVGGIGGTGSMGGYSHIVVTY